MHLVGERDFRGLSFGFNRSLRVEGRATQLTSDAGVGVLREVDDALGLSDGIADALSDGRRASRHSLSELLRTAIYLPALGYRHQSDADHLRSDPALRMAVSDYRGAGSVRRPLTSQPTLSRFVHQLSEGANPQHLSRALVTSSLSGLHLVRTERYGHTLDVDSFPIPAHGTQGGSAYNGHYRQRCFHPLLVMHEQGSIVGMKLRPGNESTSNGAKDFLIDLLDEFERHGERVKRIRGDAGFPSEELLSALEARGVSYVFRFANNSVLDRLADPHLRRPPGKRPSVLREWTRVLRYRAHRWSRERRIVLVVQERPDELYLHHFFIVTSDESTTSGQVLAIYRKRGTMEARLGELMTALPPALSSAHACKDLVRETDDTPFRVNAVTLHLTALAYNLLHTLRALAARARLDGVGNALSLSRTRRLLLSVAGRVTESGRRVLLAVSRDTERWWCTLLDRLRRRVRLASGS